MNQINKITNPPILLKCWRHKQKTHTQKCQVKQITCQINHKFVIFHHSHSGEYGDFWNVALSSLVETDQCFRGAYCPHHHYDDTGVKHLWNVSKFPTDYVAQNPGRHTSSNYKFNSWKCSFYYLDPYNTKLLKYMTHNTVPKCNIWHSSSIGT